MTQGTHPRRRPPRLRDPARAYPRAFREDVGEEMAAAFAARYRDEAARGTGALRRLVRAHPLGHRAQRRAGTAGRAHVDAARENRRNHGHAGPGHPLRAARARPAARVRDRGRAHHRPGRGGELPRSSPSSTACSSSRSPYPAADRLVILWTTTGSGNNAVAWPEYLDWRAPVARVRGDGRLARPERDPHRRGRGAGPGLRAFVTASFFDVVGARARLGRTFRPEETEPTTTQPVTVISHGLWTRRFGADPAHPRPDARPQRPAAHGDPACSGRSSKWAAPPSTAGSWGRRSGCPWPTPQREQGSRADRRSCWWPRE